MAEKGDTKHMASAGFDKIYFIEQNINACLGIVPSPYYESCIRCLHNVFSNSQLAFRHSDESYFFGNYMTDREINKCYTCSLPEEITCKM